MFNFDPIKRKDDDKKEKSSTENGNTLTVIAQRGAVGVSEKNCDDITKGHFPLPEETRELFKKEILSHLMIDDPKTGESRIADFDNEEEMKILSAKTSVMVKTPKTINNGFPKEPSTGMMLMKKKNLPKDLNTHGLLPIQPGTIAKNYEEHGQKITEMILFWPVLNLPVHVSNLFLLMNGRESTCIVNSFSAFKWYMMSLKWLANVDFIRSRKVVALEWLFDQIDKKTLKKKDLALLVKNIDSTFDDDKDVGSSLFTKPTSESYTLYPNDLIERFAEGKLCCDDVKAVYKTVKKVNRYDNCPWKGDNDKRKRLVFIEDLLQEQNTDALEIQNAFLQHVTEIRSKIIGDNTENMKDREDEYFQEVIKHMYIFTLDLLNCYEFFIRRAFDEANLEGPIFTPKYVRSFRTRRDLPPASFIGKRMAEIIVNERRNICDIRDKALRNTVRDTTPSKENKTEDLIALCLNPALDPMTMHSFQAFLDYNVEGNEELVAGADAVHKVLEDFQNARIEDAQSSKMEDVKDMMETENTNS